MVGNVMPGEVGGAADDDVDIVSKVAADGSR